MLPIAYISYASVAGLLEAGAFGEMRKKGGSDVVKATSGGGPDNSPEPFGGDGGPDLPLLDDPAAPDAGEPDVPGEICGSWPPADDVDEIIHESTLRNVSSKRKTFRKPKRVKPVDQMSDAGDRLQKARRDAGYATAADAARAFGWNVLTYQVHESGGRGLRPDVASKYARALRVSAGWLLTGVGEKAPLTRIVKVVGFVGAGAEVFAFTENEHGDGLDEVEVPYGTGENAVAVIVRGDSAFPAYEDGELLIYSEQLHDVQEFMYRKKPMIIGLRDGRRLLKQLTPGTRQGYYTLQSMNASPILDVNVDWVARIDWTKPPK